MSFWIRYDPSYAPAFNCRQTFDPMCIFHKWWTNICMFHEVHNIITIFKLCFHLIKFRNGDGYPVDIIGIITLTPYFEICY